MTAICNILSATILYCLRMTAVATAIAFPACVLKSFVICYIWCFDVMKYMTVNTSERNAPILIEFCEVLHPNNLLYKIN